jgi:hypothetical protein
MELANMLSIQKAKYPVFGFAKTHYQSESRHRLARFVTKETVALMFELKLEDIYRIECWRNIVYVHGRGVSRFVSYADFPPNLDAEFPTELDWKKWEKYWYRRSKSKQVPVFWLKFYSDRLKNASTTKMLKTWGELLAAIAPKLSKSNVQQLRDIYKIRRDVLKKRDREEQVKLIA